jgi:hypothetical protein
MTVGSIPGMGSIPNISRVPVLSYDRDNDGSCPYIRSIKMYLARSNRAQTSDPGLPSVMHMMCG